MSRLPDAKRLRKERSAGTPLAPLTPLTHLYTDHIPHTPHTPSHTFTLPTTLTHSSHTPHTLLTYPHIPSPTLTHTPTPTPTHPHTHTHTHPHTLTHPTHCTAFEKTFDILQLDGASDLSNIGTSSLVDVMMDLTYYEHNKLNSQALRLLMHSPSTCIYTCIYA